MTVSAVLALNEVEQDKADIPFDAEDELIIDPILILTGRPNCLRPGNWGRKFRHNWYVSRYWKCEGINAKIQHCETGRWFQPSKSKCVWAWKWEWEPISPPQKPPAPTWPTWPTLPSRPTPTWPTLPTRPTTPAPPPSRCEAPNCSGEMEFVLQPDWSPVHFWQCAPFGPVKMPCAPGTKFSYFHQVCVWPDQWENAC